MDDQDPQSGAAQPVLLADIDGPVATLTMSRPDRRNAMCDTLLDAIEGFFPARHPA
jgi:enoyl-CoA hydratase/carnithine racemase